MSDFGDYASALKGRDVLEEMIVKVIEKERPSPRYGTVVSIDEDLNVLQVQMPEGGDLVPVGMDSNSPLDVGQIVRVEGPRGDKYVGAIYGGIAAGSGGGAYEVKGHKNKASGYLGLNAGLSFDTNYAAPIPRHAFQSRGANIFLGRADRQVITEVWIGDSMGHLKIDMSTAQFTTHANMVGYDAATPTSWPVASAFQVNESLSAMPTTGHFQVITDTSAHASYKYTGIDTVNKRFTGVTRYGGTGNFQVVASTSTNTFPDKGTGIQTEVASLLYEQNTMVAVYEREMARAFNLQQRTSGFVPVQMYSTLEQFAGMAWDTWPFGQTELTRGPNFANKKFDALNENATITRKATSVTIYYTKYKTGGHPVEVWLNGELVDTLDNTDATITPAYESGYSKSYQNPNTVSGGRCTVQIIHTGGAAGTFELEGVYFHNLNVSSGYKLLPCTRSGLSLGEILDPSHDAEPWAYGALPGDAGTGGNDTNLQFIEQNVPQIITICLGVNDAQHGYESADTASRLEALIGDIRARYTATNATITQDEDDTTVFTPAIRYLFQAQSTAVNVNDDDWRTDYKSKLRQVCIDNDVLFVDGDLAIGATNGAEDIYNISLDGLHPYNGAHWVWGQVMADITAPKSNQPGSLMYLNSPNQDVGTTTGILRLYHPAGPSIYGVRDSGAAISGGVVLFTLAAQGAADAYGNVDFGSAIQFISEGTWNTDDVGTGTPIAVTNSPAGVRVRTTAVTTLATVGGWTGDGDYYHGTDLASSLLILRGSTKRLSMPWAAKTLAAGANTSISLPSGTNIRLTLTAVSTINSIDPGNDGDIIRLWNTSPSYSLTLTNEYGSAGAGEKIHTTTGDDITTVLDGFVELTWSADSVAWIVTSTGAAGTTGTTSGSSAFLDTAFNLTHLTGRKGFFSLTDLSNSTNSTLKFPAAVSGTTKIIALQDADNAFSVVQNFAAGIISAGAIVNTGGVGITSLLTSGGALSMLRTNVVSAGAQGLAVINAQGTLNDGSGLTATGAQILFQSSMAWPDATHHKGRILIKTSNDTALVTAITIDEAQLVTFANPLDVPSGGTGLAAITDHRLIVGNGTNVPNLLAPSSTTGIALVSQGSSADPAYSTVVVAGGGTGRTTLTAHGVLVGNGTTAITQLGAGTSGLPLLSGGSGADPDYGVLGTAGGGTGRTTLSFPNVTDSVAVLGANSFTADQTIAGNVELTGEYRAYGSSGGFARLRRSATPTGANQGLGLVVAHANNGSGSYTGGAAILFQSGAADQSGQMFLQTAAVGGTTLLNALGVGSDQRIFIYNRLLTSQGANVASANNLVLGMDGNVFEITGTTQVNLISKLAWQDGAIVYLMFTSTPTVKHNQTTSGNNTKILLDGAVDFVATAGDILPLMLCTLNTVQAWRQIAPATRLP